MPPLRTIFIYAGILLCVLLAILLCRFNQAKRLQNYILAALFLILAWFGFIYLLIISRTLLDYPFLFRLGMPFYYLIPPLTLMYCQLAITGQNKIRLDRCLPHILPFFIALSDLVVYYTKHFGKLEEVVKAVYQDPLALFFTGGGFIPAVAHYALRPIQAIIYMFLIGLFLIKAYQHKQLSQIHKADRNWVFLLFLFLTTFYACNFFYTFIHPLTHFITASADLTAVMLLSICFFLVPAHLFFFPQLVYPSLKEYQEKPLPVKTPSSLTEKEIQSVNALISLEKVNLLAKEIEQAMEEKELFRSITKLSDLANHLQTSPRYLSYVFSNHYQLHFNDFLNTFRVKYVIKQLEEGAYRHYTLEAIANQAGFSSRSTFYTAFKKQIGQTPSQYLDFLTKKV